MLPRGGRERRSERRTTDEWISDGYVSMDEKRTRAHLVADREAVVHRLRGNGDDVRAAVVPARELHADRLRERDVVQALVRGVVRHAAAVERAAVRGEDVGRADDGSRARARGRAARRERAAGHRGGRGGGEGGDGGHGVRGGCGGAVGGVRRACGRDAMSRARRASYARRQVRRGQEIEATSRAQTRVIGGETTSGYGFFFRFGIRVIQRSERDSPLLLTLLLATAARRGDESGDVSESHGARGGEEANGTERAKRRRDATRPSSECGP